jgi:hypothetical protein
VAEGVAARAASAGVSQDMVVTGLLTEAQFFGEGSSHGARVSAWEKLGKHLGMFVEQRNLNVTGKLTHVAEELPATDNWLEGLPAGAETGAHPKPRLQ